MTKPNRKTELSTMEGSLLDDPTCYRCKAPLPPPLSENYPTQREGCLIVRLVGGYEMFHDIVDLDCVIDVFLCHACYVEIFRFLKFHPTTMSDMRGLHPYSQQNVPCCEYGWTRGIDNDGEPSVIFGFEDKGDLNGG